MVPLLLHTVHQWDTIIQILYTCWAICCLVASICSNRIVLMGTNMGPCCLLPFSFATGINGVLFFFWAMLNLVVVGFGLLNLVECLTWWMALTCSTWMALTTWWTALVCFCRVLMWCGLCSFCGLHLATACDSSLVALGIGWSGRAGWLRALSLAIIVIVVGCFACCAIFCAMCLCRSNLPKVILLSVLSHVNSTWSKSRIKYNSNRSLIPVTIIIPPAIEDSFPDMEGKQIAKCFKK